MKIFHVLQGIEPGGTEWQCARVSNELRKLGHQVMLLFPTEPKNREVLNYIRINKVPYRSLGAMHFLQAVQQFIENEKPDIVTGYLHPFGLQVTSIARMLNIPGVVRYEDLGILLDQDQQLPSVDIDTVFSVCSIPVAEVYSKQIKNSEDNSWIFIPQGTEITPAWTDKERKKVKALAALKEIDFVVMHRANFKPVKNQIWFLDVADILLNSSPLTSWKFVFAGSALSPRDQDYLDELKLVILSRFGDMKHRFVFPGNVSNEICGIADVGVLTSESEGFGNVITEFMNAGVPVVTRGNVGLHSMFKNWLEIIYADTPEEFARGIQIIQRNPKRGQLMAKAAKEVVTKSYSIEIVGRMWENLYLQILRARGSGVSLNDLKAPWI